jgi:hypothetical protein
MAPYRYLYPFNDESLRRIAYYFDYDYAPDVDPTGYAAEVIEYVQTWQREPEMGTLYAITRPEGTLALIDTRSGTTCPDLILSGPEQSAYEYCDSIRSGTAVVQYLREKYPDTHFDTRRVQGFLDSLVANRLMVTDDIHYLSLAIMPQPVQTHYERGTRLPGIQAADADARPASSYLSSELWLTQ